MDCPRTIVNVTFEALEVLKYVCRPYSTSLFRVWYFNLHQKLKVSLKSLKNVAIIKAKGQLHFATIDWQSSRICSSFAGVGYLYIDCCQVKKCLNIFGGKTFEAFTYLDSYCNILSCDSVSLVHGHQPVWGTFCLLSASALLTSNLLTTFLKECQ